MDVKLVIMFMVVYVWVYYFLARRVLADIRKVDPDYFEYSGARGGIGMENSLAVGRLIFDVGMPKDFYPGVIKVRLMIVRVMLGATPVVFVALLLMG